MHWVLFRSLASIISVLIIHIRWYLFLQQQIRNESSCKEINWIKVIILYEGIFQKFSFINGVSRILE